MRKLLFVNLSTLLMLGLFQIEGSSINREVILWAVSFLIKLN